MDKLDVIVVPLRNAYAVLPAVMLRQILPSAPLMPQDENSMDYVLGMLIVQNDKLPVIDASLFIANEAVKKDEDIKLIWFGPIHKNSNSGGFILKSNGSPQFIACRSGDIIDIAPGEQPLVARRVQIRGLSNPHNLPVFIIDLEALAKELES